MSTREKRHQLRRGITFVEIMIVLTLVGVMTAMGFPRVASAMRHGRVNQAAAIVAADLESAFSLAARQRKAIRITYNSGAGEIQFADRADPTKILRRRALGSDTEWRLTSVSFSTPVVDVHPSGAASSALTVQLVSNGYTRTVTMTRVGLVQVSQ